MSVQVEPSPNEDQLGPLSSLQRLGEALTVLDERRVEEFFRVERRIDFDGLVAFHIPPNFADFCKKNILQKYINSNFLNENLNFRDILNSFLQAKEANLALFLVSLLLKKHNSLDLFTFVDRFQAYLYTLVKLIQVTLDELLKIQQFLERKNCKFEDDESISEVQKSKIAVFSQGTEKLLKLLWGFVIQGEAVQAFCQFLVEKGKLSTVEEALDGRAGLNSCELLQECCQKGRKTLLKWQEPSMYLKAMKALSALACLGFQETTSIAFPPIFLTEELMCKFSLACRLQRRATASIVISQSYGQGLVRV